MLVKVLLAIPLLLVFAIPPIYAVWHSESKRTAELNALGHKPDTSQVAIAFISFWCMVTVVAAIAFVVIPFDS